MGVARRPIDVVTETSEPVDGPAPLLGGRTWVHMAWWLFAWNVGVPIRLLGMLGTPRAALSMERSVGMLVVDQTSWAIVTYAVAIVLLFVTSLSLWVTLIFPAWVLGVSILILVQNYRRRTAPQVS